MTSNSDPNELTVEWKEAYNSHDLERIVAPPLEVSGRCWLARGAQPGAGPT